MKKKLFIASAIILLLFILVLALSLRQAKKSTESPNTTLKDAAQQTKADFEFGQALEKLYQQYPWYSKIPIITDNFEIVFDFDENAFRIILENDSETIRNNALKEIEELGDGADQLSYYFVKPDGTTESQSGFQNLLR